MLELLETLLDLAHQHSDATANSPESLGSLRALLGSLLPCYGASLSRADKAVHRCLLLLDRIIVRMEHQGQVTEGPLAILHGPLASSGCVCC